MLAWPERQELADEVLPQLQEVATLGPETPSQPPMRSREAADTSCTNPKPRGPGAGSARSWARLRPVVARPERTAAAIGRARAPRPLRPWSCCRPPRVCRDHERSACPAEQARSRWPTRCPCNKSQVWAGPSRAWLFHAWSGRAGVDALVTALVPVAPQPSVSAASNGRADPSGVRGRARLGDEHGRASALKWPVRLR